MFDPDADISAIWEVLANDTKILSLVEWVNGKPKSELIYKGNEIPSKLDSNRICLYFAPSRRTRNQIVSEEVIQIDCHSPRPETTRQMVKRVAELVNRETLNGRQLWFAGQLGDLTTAKGYSCAGVRFRYSTVV